MDNAVALVQTYLRVNGYFTVAEYPVVEAARPAGVRARTDIDIIAIRFPQLRHHVPSNGQEFGGERYEPDPHLRARPDEIDMIIGEVKEGDATVNPALRDAGVLSAALARFGCCSWQDTEPYVRTLLDRGEVVLPAGHRARIVAFGSVAGERQHGVHSAVSLGHAAMFLRGYLRKYWYVFSHTQVKDPVLSLMLTLEKARRGLTEEEAEAESALFPQ